MTTLHSFCAVSGCPDGLQPQGDLTQGMDGNLYGTTTFGGNCSWNSLGCGTVFRITLNGVLTTLHTFCSLSGCPDGREPLSGLIQGTDGYLYGTTNFGGAHQYGTIFKITPKGALTTLYSFSGNDGVEPAGHLTQASDGNLYGMTQGGGTGSYPGGTVFKLTTKGALTTLYTFPCTVNSCPDGGQPLGALAQGTDGNFYGTTYVGGDYSGACAAFGCGTLFMLTPAGTMTTLHTFSASESNPSSGVMQSTDGNFYGTTFGGLTGTDGSVFLLSAGLSPFVKSLPTSGKVGAVVKILGTNLMGATSVTFNGTPAVFTVIRPSLITTTVPAGATTGTLQVTTPAGTLMSNVAFHVRQ